MGRLASVSYAGDTAGAGLIVLVGIRRRRKLEWSMGVAGGGGV
jgi:hypothetical protein